MSNPLVCVRQEVYERKTSCGHYAMMKMTTGKIWPALCRGRACRRRECRELYCRRTIKKLGGIEAMNEFHTMITLTLDQKKYPVPQDAWNDITRLWNNLCRELRRIYGKFPYVWCLEKHPTNEYPHLHIATSRFIPVNTERVSKPGDRHYNPKEKPLSELWQSVGGGCIVDARFIENGITQYMCKGLSGNEVYDVISTYVTKDLINVGDYVKKGSRVWGCSRGLKRPEEKKSEEVRFMKSMKVFDENLNLILTDEQIERTIRYETDKASEYTAKMEKKSELTYEEDSDDKGQERKDMAGSCQGGVETRGKEVASDQRRPQKQSQDPEAPQPKTQGKRGNPPFKPIVGLGMRDGADAGGFNWSHHYVPEPLGSRRGKR